ncbi:MAG: DUF1559 domain-containing protein, partial [Planctomycetaceae bacterium]|nr:DUF1559 domain-containing protein [Planctomycetaceae bacterium]
WIIYAGIQFRPTGYKTLGMIFIPGFWILCILASAFISWIRKESNEVAPLVVAVVGVSILWVFLSPPHQGHGEASRRSACKNNLKMVGLALQNYHDVYSAFPSQASGEPPMSWRVALLPYMDQAPLFREYDQSADWNAAVNQPVAKRRIDNLMCPAVPREIQEGEYPYTAYVVPVGPNVGWQSQRAFSDKEFEDGVSNTIAVMEACGQQIPWAEPRDLPVPGTAIGMNLPGREPHRSEGIMSAYHRGGSHLLLFDGAVRFFHEDVDPAIVEALLTPNGGEVVIEF